MQPTTKRDAIALCLIGTAIFTGISFVSSLPFSTAIGCSAANAVLIILYFFALRKYVNPDTSLTPLLSSAPPSEQTALVDGLAEAVLIIDRRERVSYANPAAKALFPAFNLGSTIGGIISDRGLRSLASNALIQKDAGSVTFELNRPVERHFRATGKKLAPQKGQPDTQVQAILVFYDITDIVRVNAMRSDFLANASHELKTPIASLLGYIETLRGHAKDDPEARETFLGIMQQQAERMQRLIADLLSLRRIELVEHLAPKQTADLYLATRAAMEAVEPMAKANGVSIKYSGPKTALVTGVQDELVQLVLNLLDNAVAFTPQNGIVHLSLNILPDWHPGQIFSEDREFFVAHKRRIVMPSHVNPAFAALRIRDAGPGLKKDHLQRLCERFYKVTDQKKRPRHGTGLGLAIVKHIILRHRGGLFVESAENIGTKFTILLPVATKRK